MGETLGESGKHRLYFPAGGALEIDRRLPPGGLEADGQRGHAGRLMARKFLQL